MLSAGLTQTGISDLRAGAAGVSFAVIKVGAGLGDVGCCGRELIVPEQP